MIGNNRDGALPDYPEASYVYDRDKNDLTDVELLGTFSWGTVYLLVYLALCSSFDVTRYFFFCCTHSLFSNLYPCGTP